ncbi:MAG: hypothetical protein ABSE69_16005 [Roseiarcus sp.]|jgi:predicted  nucleic acid-binding Zn-ribbon protein
MPKKTQDKLTQAEKIEDLRKEIKAAKAAVKRLGESHHDLMIKQATISNLLSEVSLAVRNLEDRFAKPDQ